MNTPPLAPDETHRDIDLVAADLPLACPRPGAPLWARHPRVFIDVTTSGEGVCPYCGTRYRYQGPRPATHH
jgi:uncharacterized Zn-finger protein